MKKAKGFTLLEILIALFIFIILSAIATTGLYQVFQTKEIQEKHYKAFSELQMAYVIIRNDLEQIIDRPILDNDGTTRLRALIGETATMQFSRSGHINPLAEQKISHIKRIAYVVKEGQLIRQSWPVLDRAQNTTVEEQVLLSQISDFKIRYLVDEQQSYEFWPPSGQYLSESQSQSSAKDVFPKAIVLTLDNLVFGPGQLMVTIHANSLKFKQAD